MSEKKKSRKTAMLLALVIALVVIFLMLGPFYILEEGQQAVVTRFGKIVNNSEDAGLKFKVPILDQVHKYSKRVLSWDGEAQRLPTLLKKYIWVDSTARWKIVDPILFYESLTTMEAAFSRLDGTIDPSVRTIIAKNRLKEAVRSSTGIGELDIITMQETKENEANSTFLVPLRISVKAFEADIIPFIKSEADIKFLKDMYPLNQNENFRELRFTRPQDINEDKKDKRGMAQKTLIRIVDAERILDLMDLTEYTSGEEEYPGIRKGRQRLAEEMLRLAWENTREKFGIELIDIKLRQIRYSDELIQAVYERMISERRKIAEEYISDGRGRKQRRLGELQQEKESILARAYAEAEDIKGKADAEATVIYSRAYRLNQDFFEFWRAIESYRKVLPQFSKTLTTDMEYFDFLYQKRK